MRTDLTIRKGQAFTLVFVMKQDLTTIINTTNYTFLIKIRPNNNTQEEIISWHSSIGLPLISRDNVNGTVALLLDEDYTNNMTPFEPAVMNIWAWDTQNPVATLSADYSIGYSEV